MPGIPNPPGLDYARLARTFELLAEHEERQAKGRRLAKTKHEELHKLLAAKGGHVYGGRIPMNDAEHAAVDRLLNRHGGQGFLTRRDPGNTGPVLVHVGDTVYEVAADGRAKKKAVV